jgi:hypothetical protein
VLATKELAIAMQTFAPRRKIDGFGFDYYDDDHDPLAGRDILMLWDDPRGWFHGRVSRREREGALKPGIKRLRECNGFMTWRIVFAKDARWGQSSLEDRTIAMDLPHSRRGRGDEQSDRGQWVLLSEVWIDGQRIVDLDCESWMEAAKQQQLREAHRYARHAERAAVVGRALYAMSSYM